MIVELWPSKLWCGRLSILDVSSTGDGGVRLHPPLWLAVNGGVICINVLTACLGASPI